MNAADVVGYAEDGEIYCPDCGDSRMSPIFAGEEWDYAPTCEECGEVLDVCVLHEEEDDEWAEGADESRSNGAQTVYRFALPGAGSTVNLYIDTDQGIPTDASIESCDMPDHIEYLHSVCDSDLELAEWMQSWGYDGLDYATPALPDDPGECAIWRERHYYAGTINAPMSGYDRDDDGELIIYADYAAAKEAVDAYYGEPSGYNGIARCNVLSHGQAAADTLTIISL